jgi:formate hydrogenlyase transcriptional activator
MIYKEDGFMFNLSYQESSNGGKPFELIDVNERYRIILEINDAIISNLKLYDLFQATANAINGKLHFDSAGLSLYEPERDVLKAYAVKTFSPLDRLSPDILEMPRVGSLIGWAFDNKRSLVATDLSREQRFATDKIILEAGLRSYVVTPLMVGERAIGTFNMGSKTPNKFQEADVDFLSLVAKQIAIAIDNVRSHEEIEKLKCRLERENISLKEEIKIEYNFDEIIGESNALKKVLAQIEMVAKTDSTVLIRGETGTGKELIARAINNLSKRKGCPLIKVNCPAIPSGLIESELFGHERGAFTGALSRKIGKFELADGGTIFLDEIGELPLEAQAKLLRVLQEREFERIGGTSTFKVDVRVIAATNRDLEAAVKEGKFRADLFYRLNVFPITLPPLRERREDIPLLIRHLARKYIIRMGKEIKSVSERAIERLKEYSWPGNIRELENVVERAVILSTSDVLEINEGLIGSFNVSANGDKLLSLEDLEREHIIRVLNQTGWQIEGHRGAAKILGLNPSTLRGRTKKLDIKRNKLDLVKYKF